ncbi:MAG: hypothetical protein R3D44_05885 [Hyphomicrobiaceae bacterium]
MTDFDAATARTTKLRVGAAIGLVIAGFGLAGCETASTVLGGSQVASETVAPKPAAEPAKPQMVARIALAPIIGAPDRIGQQLRSQVVQSAERNKIGILADRDASADFSMRGYLVAARDRGGIKVSYIWDVTDPSGKRVNRVTGEENVAGAGAAKDPWSAVTPAVTQTIADKVASSLGAWAPSQPKATPVASAAPSPGSRPGAAGAGASTLPRAASAVAAAPPPAAPASATTATTTAALPAGGGLPVVTGAPGDGNTSLASALNRELVRQGMPVERQTGRPYRVEGQVTLGAVKDGRQPIQIDWRVKDAQGNAVGTVTQKNAIPPGSLDGSWGQTADAAAAAAAQGILKLLPQQSAAKATN